MIKEQIPIATAGGSICVEHLVLNTEPKVKPIKWAMVPNKTASQIFPVYNMAYPATIVVWCVAGNAGSTKI